MNQTNTSKRIPTQINEFRGDYAFLSNFYPAPVSYMGQTYANNEAAFQAQKTLSAREQRKFCIFRMHNPSEGNNWGDYFWGKVNNCGENQLGIILMDVRAKLQWNAETAPNNIPQCLQ